jgi:hypothetical protein
MLNLIYTKAMNFCQEMGVGNKKGAAKIQPRLYYTLHTVR